MNFDKNSYLIYTRRSTDDVLNQKNSIEHQVEQCLRYVESNGLTVAAGSVSSFCEEGIIKERHTAFKTSSFELRPDGTISYRIERPKFQQLIVLLTRRQIRGAICLCWDRLSRNSHDDAVIKDLIAQGVDVRFVQATYEKSSAGALHMDIDGMFSAHWSRLSGEKIRATNAKLRAEGKCTNRAPVGYLDHGPGDKPLDPERAPVIKQLFELYATGEWSVAQLTRWALTQGLTTKPMRAKRTRDEIAQGSENSHPKVSRPITDKHIEQILHTAFYCGLLSHANELLPGRHAPLISKDLFDQVQRTLRRRTTSIHYVNQRFSTYRGMVRCSCSRLFSPYVQKEHTYYRVKCREGCPNNVINLPEQHIDALVEELFGKLHPGTSTLAKIEAQAPKEISQMEERHEKDRALLEREQLRLERDLTYLRENKITLLREGAYGAGDFAAEVQRLEDARDAIIDKQEILASVAPAQMLETVLSFLELVNLAQQSYCQSSPQEKRMLATAVFLELHISDSRIAEVRAKDGFQEVLNRRVSLSCAPKFVFLELPTLYRAATLASERLQSALSHGEDVSEA